MRASYIIILSFVFLPLAGMAQPYKTIKVYKPYNWMIGVHWNVVEDNGNQFGGLFDVKNSWNYLYYPSRLSLDKYFKYGWSIEMAASYNKYESGKIINDTTNIETHFFSFDVNGKYSFYTKYIPRAKWIDPYLTFGVGYTYRGAGATTHVPTLNLGAGVNFWIKNFGIQIHSQAKGSLFPGFWDFDYHDNYLQHSLGLVYRFGEGVHTNGYFGKPKHKWGKKNQRYKKRKGQ